MPAVIELDIVAVDRQTLDTVKRELRKRIDEMAAESVEIADQLVAHSDECRRDISSLKTTSVDVAVGV